MGDREELGKLLKDMAQKKETPAPQSEFLRYALEQLKAEKPNDRSETDRRYAVCITELEKVIGYYVTWIVMAA